MAGPTKVKKASKPVDQKFLAKEIYDLPDELVFRAAEAHEPQITWQKSDIISATTYSTVEYNGKKMRGSEFRLSFLNTLKPKTIEYLGSLTMGIVPPSKAVALIPKGFARSVINVDPAAYFASKVFTTALETASFGTSLKDTFSKNAYKDIVVNLYKVLLRTDFFKVSRKNDDLVQLLKHAAESRSRSLHGIFNKTSLPRDAVNSILTMSDDPIIHENVMKQLFKVYKVTSVKQLFAAV